MTREQGLYGALCVLAVLIGLYPSVFLNVKPFMVHEQWGSAALQFFLTLIAAAIPLIIFRLHWLEATIAGLLLMGLLRVSVANGIESVTLTRSEISSGRVEKEAAKGDWKARIETWTSERDSLKTRFIPLKGEQSYVPTSGEVVATAREGRDASCKYPSSESCKSAQTRLEQVTQNFELTKRVDQLEQDIRDAQTRITKVGSTPPDYLGQAQKALAGAWLDPLQDREVWLAYIAEGVAAFAPKFLVFLVSFLFTATLGEKWWQESLRQESTVENTNPVQEVEYTSPQISTAPRHRYITSPKRLNQAMSVEAWVKSVLPAGGKRKRYTPGQAHPHYREFCEREGYTPCHLNVFGSILKTECGLRPVVVVGGCSHYEFTIQEVTKLALVNVR